MVHRRQPAGVVKTYYAAVSAKTADDALASLQKIENDHHTEEVEVRQIIPFGQKALVIYLRYERGVVR